MTGLASVAFGIYHGPKEYPKNVLGMQITLRSLYQTIGKIFAGLFLIHCTTTL